MSLIEPFYTTLNHQEGRLQPTGQVIQRYLSQMKNMYLDEGAYNQIMADEEDRLIYEVFNAPDIPQVAGQILHCTTVIYPGRIGQEFHMTKGHFHAIRDRAEIYVGLNGEGYLLLMTDDGEAREIVLAPGVVAYIPPYWAHRTVNTGDQPFSFLSAWPGDAGHDYGSIETSGFAKLLIEQAGKVAIVDNPQYAR